MSNPQESAIPARSEDELFPLGGPRPIVKLTLGGLNKPIRELSARDNEAWKLKLAQATGGRLTSIQGLESTAQLGALFSGVTDVQVEMIVAYDAEGRLGGADWIMDNASASEIWEAFKGVLQAVFPFLVDARRAPSLVAEILPQLVVLLGKPPSRPGAEGSTT